MAPPKLVVLPVSPWSERARWALGHHGLAYRTVEHVPFIGEGRLRRLARRPTGRVTAPVLIDGDLVLTESWDIVKHADRLGAAARLIPADREAEVRGWVERADRSMGAGRALVVAAMLRSPEALDEGLPPAVPALVRRALRPVGRYGMRWFARKYGLALDDAAGSEGGLREGLDALRGALRGGSPHLLGAFSYADIAMATLLQGIAPVEGGHIPLGPATRRAWTRPALSAEYADLVRWRDDLYRRHRGGAAAR
jgi:glutathione S-transferase